MVCNSVRSQGGFLNHSKIRDINFTYDKVIIGSSLEALLYSFLNNLPFVYTNSRCPHRFSFFEPDVDLSFFGIQNETRTLVGPTSEKYIGISKDTVWERLYFYLSLAGLNPLADKLSSIRIEDGVLKAFSHKARMAKIQFEQLIVFDDLPSYTNRDLFDKLLQLLKDHLFYCWLID